MKTVVSILLPFFYAAAAPAGIDALIEAARAAPPEFASDALIRIAATGQVDRARKLELLEQAFQRAAGAEQPFKRRAAFSPPNSRAGHWNRVYGQDLDGLSLRLRVVAAMLPLDGRKARDFFLQIPPVRPPRVKCEEFLVYDVDRFYELLGDVARQTFSEKEVQEGQPLRLLARYAAAIASPVEIAPMARTIAAANLKDAEFEKLIASFAAALGKIAGDDRSFAYAYTAGRAIESLVGEMNRRELSPLPLIERYRLYLVTNLSAARCADDDLVTGSATSFGLVSPEQQANQQAADFAGFFNSRLRMPPLQPIAEQESTPASMEGVASGLRLCQDEGCRAMAGQYRRLVLKDSGTPYPPSERNTAEWQARLRAFLEAVNQWKPDAGTPAAEYFEERCQAYSDLLNIADGSNRELVVHSLLDFAGSNPLQTTNRLEWFLPLNGLIGRLSLDPMGWEKLAAEVRQSKNPVIALYAALEAAAPRTPDRILPLL